jgi:hypothetical protein
MALTKNSAYTKEGGYGTLKNGSVGSQVKKLQETLTSLGYSVGSTGADGIYGKATAAAVKQYQKDNGLSVDGIAGKNTLGSLYSTGTTGKTGNTGSTSSTSGTGSKKPTTTPADTKGKASTATEYAEAIGSPVKLDPFTYDDYTPSEAVQNANAILQQHRDNQPGAYQSQWQDEIDEYLGLIKNRDPFSYDFNTDALYQQYRDLYTQQGQMAMMDTMGQAAAMTGGYGNSYAQTVGQQAYNQQLSQLNSIMPELYSMAYDRYAQEGQQLQDMYNMYQGLESQDYGRYQTDLGNWYTQLEYLTDSYNTERELDYDRYQVGRQEAYKQYATEQDRAWDEYLADRQKEQAVAELMAGAGDYDRLAAVYGLSADEVAAIKAANTPTTTATGKKKYTKLTLDALDTMQKAVSRTGNLGDLSALAQTYVAMGYDPAVINNITSGKALDLRTSSQTPVDTTVTASTSTTDARAQAQANNRNKDKLLYMTTK